jgi:hypothetical protein
MIECDGCGHAMDESEAHYIMEEWFCDECCDEDCNDCIAYASGE